MSFEVPLPDISELNTTSLFCRFGTRTESEKKSLELNSILNKDINFFYLYINHSILQNNILLFPHISIVHTEDTVHSIHTLLHYTML